MRNSIPIVIQEFLFALTTVMIQTAINSFGSVVTAGSGAAGNVENMVFAIISAFYHASMTFTSQNMGAKNYRRVVRTFVDCSIFTVLTGLALGIGACLFAEPLLGLYTSDPVVIQAGIERFTYVTRFYFLCGLMDVMLGTLRGTGHAALAMVMSLIGVCGVRIFWLYVLVPRIHTSVCVYLSYAAAWAATCLILAITMGILGICFLRKKKEISKLAVVS